MKALEQFIDRLGLRYFKGARDFTPYWSRVRNGVRNGPPPESLWQNVVQPLVVLDEIRHRLGEPVTIISSYRRPAYNGAIPGASSGSFHMKFLALDWTADVTVAKMHSMAKSMRGKKFQYPGNNGHFIFRGGIGRYPGNHFIHIDGRGYDADWTG